MTTPRKHPRAPVREGRPSPALGANDHRSRKIAVPKPIRPQEPIDEVPLDGTETDSQRRAIEALNEIIRDFNDED